VKTKTVLISRDSTLIELHRRVWSLCTDHEAQGWAVKIIRPVEDAIFIVFEMLPPQMAYGSTGTPVRAAAIPQPFTSISGIGTS